LALLQNLAEISLALDEKKRLTFDLRGPPLAHVCPCGEEAIGLQNILDLVELIAYNLEAGSEHASLHVRMGEYIVQTRGH
jgi:hypothetical protein